jgi:hypothetical protein
MPARVAFQAGNVMMQRNPVADFKTLKVSSHFHNRPGGFVSENPRQGNRSVPDFFYVRRTDAANGHLDEQLAGTDPRDRDGFDAEVVRAAINDGTHGLRDHEHGERNKPLMFANKR